MINKNLVYSCVFSTQYIHVQCVANHLMLVALLALVF